MPIYEYKCTECGQKKEVLQKLSDPPLRECPSCGKATLSKLISAAGFHLKGSGWYATDFKGGGAKAGKEKENQDGKAPGDGKTPEAAKATTDGKAPEAGKTTTGGEKAKEGTKAEPAAGSAGASTVQ
jgi:putative FmdB family regulatory protein